MRACQSPGRVPRDAPFASSRPGAATRDYKPVRKVLIAVVLLGVVVVVAGVLVPLAASTPALRARVLALASAASGRTVEASDVDVAPFFSSLRLRDLRVSNPSGFGDEPMLEAESITLDVGPIALLRGRLVGELRGSGVTARVVERGDRTNLDDLGGEQDPAAAQDGVPMDLAVDLEDSILVVEREGSDTLRLEGVGLETRLRDEGAIAQPVTLRVDALERGGLRLRDVRLEALGREGRWEIKDLRAEFAGGGTLRGRGSFDPDGGWSLDLDAERVALDEHFRILGSAMLPLLAGAGPSLDGVLDGTWSLRGSGFTWEEVRRSLAGRGSVHVTGLEAPADAAALRLARMAGAARGAYTLRDGTARFGIENGWMRFETLRGRVGDLPLTLDGRVSLGGELDLVADLAPLARRIGEGPLQRVAGKADRLPVRIGGTVTAPRITAPGTRDLEQTIEKGLERGAKDALQDALKRIAP